METSTRLPMATRRTRLRPPTSAFIDGLYELAATDVIPWPWPVAGVTPAAFRESLWNDVLAQFAIEDVRTGHAIGIVSAYGANPVHGYAFVSVLLHPDFHRRVWPLEGALLFFNFLFVKFGLEHLYAESVAPYYEQFRSGAGSVFELEATFKDRAMFHGRREDVYVLTFSKARWLELGRPLLERCLAPAGPPSGPRP